MLKHRVEKINESTWRINEFNLVNAFLVEGKEDAALIDTGCGLGEIDECAKEITDNGSYLVIIENRTPPTFCFAIYYSIDNVPCDGITAQFFPLHAHILREMGSQSLFYG